HSPGLGLRRRGLPADQLLGSRGRPQGRLRPHGPRAMTVGLIGFGRLGKLLTRYFARDFRFFVYDRKPRPAEVRKLGAQPATLALACAQDLVIPCVPIAAFEAAIKDMRRHLRPDALVVDVCSVKQHPVRVMKRLLPKSVEILATHPNFGPDSAA